MKRKRTRSKQRCDAPAEAAELVALLTYDGPLAGQAATAKRTRRTARNQRKGGEEVVNRTPLHTEIQETAEQVSALAQRLVSLVEKQQVGVKSGVELMTHGEITRDTASRRRQLGLDPS